MREVECNEHINNVVNELTAQYLEQVCSLFGHKIHIEDTDWQTVYDLKVIVFEKLEELGLQVK